MEYFNIVCNNYVDPSIIFSKSKWILRMLFLKFILRSFKTNRLKRMSLIFRLKSLCTTSWFSSKQGYKLTIKVRTNSREAFNYYY